MWQLGVWRRRWEDNIKMALRKIVYKDGRWMNLAQYHVTLLDLA
jgi:hypothetical protein